MRYSYFIFALGSLLLFCAPLRAATYKPDGDTIGKSQSYTTKKGDGYPQIARKFDLGLAELLRANPDINTRNKLKPGIVLNIPTAHILPAIRSGIVLNLAELRLYFFAADGSVSTFPVAVGREGWETPLGETTITMKRKDPVWTPPASIREENPELPDTIPAGPDNPLGAYAITLGWPNYAIHGTNHPYAVGKRTSHGCIRLYPEDIEQLYGWVNKGMSVTTVNAPYKFGWKGDTLYLSAVKSAQPLTDDEIHHITEQIAARATVDWNIVQQAVGQHSGLPVAIGKKKLLGGLFR